MIISDLNHIEEVTEASKVQGGFFGGFNYQSIYVKQTAIATVKGKYVVGSPAIAINILGITATNG
ncbi:hypothetical protein [Brunnivagina elsteri]|uniref:Uncharacterized protein n=1 Tax=Brunnivagina elsteri CCALA 953 TaxID=987040 RepID=A0A2A2TJW9_9CYAN|nr:hypothetical protein [Calothrix elsteri]PAX55875.1 hypothetical protein CK510_10870 [Calothrix elsteri CCALA 953]